MGQRLRGVAAALLMATAACGDGNVFSLDPGTCFDDVAELTGEGDGEVDEVPVVDCAEPHDNEVFAAFDLEGDTFPGADEVLQLAREGCTARFEDYVGTDLASSRYATSYLVPTQRTWDATADREVVCFLYDRDLAPLEGSAEGSATAPGPSPGALEASPTARPSR